LGLLSGYTGRSLFQAYIKKKLLLCYRNVSRSQTANVISIYQSIPFFKNFFFVHPFFTGDGPVIHKMAPFLVVSNYRKRVILTRKNPHTGGYFSVACLKG